MRRFSFKEIATKHGANIVWVLGTLGAALWVYGFLSEPAMVGMFGPDSQTSGGEGCITGLDSP
jgi:hypothetical protein